MDYQKWNTVRLGKSLLWLLRTLAFESWKLISLIPTTTYDSRPNLPHYYITKLLVAITGNLVLIMLPGIYSGQ